MPALSEACKAFIVQQLAMWRTPTQVADLVKEEFGHELDRQQVHYYNPERAGGREVAKKWRVLFDDTRAAYREAQADIGIANQVVRLQRMEDLYTRAMSQGRGNVPLAISILKQAAEETGGKFTNHHVLEHSGKVETGGVLVVPAAATAVGEWMAQAMGEQANLERTAAEAAAGWEEEDGPSSEP